MVKTQQVKQYCIADDMPQVNHLPHGDAVYNKLFYYEDLHVTVSNVGDELANVLNSLNKYDRPTEPEHAEMCKQLRSLRDYLLVCRAQLDKEL